MKSERREIEDTGIAFLAVISCGFGAISLLLVLTVFEPAVEIEESIKNLEGYLAALEKELYELRGEARNIDRRMLGQEDQHGEQLDRLDLLNLQLEAAQAKQKKTFDSARLYKTIEGQLAAAKQSLTKELASILADYKKAEDDHKIGGIPVDSEYVIFIIDTSGSMTTNAWPLVLQKVSETLAVYPDLKGVQVMNDMGDYMFPQYTDAWIPDTPARRNAIINRLRDWHPFSNSSPVEGIKKAISTFYRSDRKISLYVFGDQFTGRSIQRVVEIVDRVNRTDSKGERLVRIHAVGFPVVHQAYRDRDQKTGVRFAILMRALCERNGGTFVGLNDFRGGGAITNPI